MLVEVGFSRAACKGVRPSWEIRKECEVAPLKEGEDANPEDEEMRFEEDPSHLFVRAPLKPTPQEVEEHLVSHIPFRSWCSSCVRGRGPSFRHVRVDHDSERLPTIAVDYGFLGDGSEPASETPILVAKCRYTKFIWAIPVPSKGVENMHGSTALLEAVKETGYRRLILKSDQEPSIIALCRSVRDGFHGDIVLENAPKESHEKSNGEAENAVKLVAGMARTLHEELKLRGVTVGSRHPLLAWLVAHCGSLLSLFGRGGELNDGHTPYQRLQGKEWRVALPPFGEVVEYRRRTKDKLEGRWRDGIFLGVKRTTTERIVGDETGVYVVQSIRRVPEDRRWNQTLADSIIGTPWQPNAKKRWSHVAPTATYD